MALVSGADEAFCVGRQQVSHGDVAEFESEHGDECWRPRLGDQSTSEEAIFVGPRFARCYCNGQGQHLCKAQSRQWASACEAKVAEDMLDGRAEWVNRTGCDGEICSDEPARDGADCTSPQAANLFTTYEFRCCSEPTVAE